MTPQFLGHKTSGERPPSVNINDRAPCGAFNASDCCAEPENNRLYAVFKHESAGAGTIVLLSLEDKGDYRNIDVHRAFWHRFRTVCREGFILIHKISDPRAFVRDFSAAMVQRIARLAEQRLFL